MLLGFKKYFHYDKTKHENLLDDDKNRLSVFLNRFISFLVISFIAVLIFESIWDNSLVYFKPIFIFDAFVSSVFALEYFYRFMRAIKKIQFLWSIYQSTCRLLYKNGFVRICLWKIQTNMQMTDAQRTIGSECVIIS